MQGTDVWQYPSATGVTDGTTSDLTEYGVEALDGSIGKVDEATYEVGRSSIVVDTGPWIFGKKVMLPAGVIERVDHDEEKVYVHRTKDEIKDAPELTDDLRSDDSYRRELGGYYSPGGAGYRDMEGRRN